MPSWDEPQYRKFLDARTRPARELLARLPLTAAKRVIDLGCGPGNSTELLVERWPGARVIGVDSSPEMLRSARESLPDVEWVQADVRDYRPAGPVDVLFANAVLHWLPDHPRLFVELLEQLEPGGALAIQMPFNHDEPSHRWMRELPGRWASKLADVSPKSAVHAPEFYYDLLAPRASALDIWQTRYEQVMADPDAIVEWVKGTGLRPFLERLDRPECDDYLRAYRDAIAKAYPIRADGRRLFSFPRLFLMVVR
jgi:trans-aconitate 2-methyltransferase